MNEFLESLETEAHSRASLAQRSLTMAREMGREMARSAPDDDGTVSVERLPDSPPVSPFSLEMYLDSLVTKLNRSASFVRRGQRRHGVRNASVQLRLNPDGSIRTFIVLNSGDQHDEIAFIQALVERAAPYSPFPPDLTKSAKSLAITICIVPTRGGGSLGFSRNLDGHSC